MIGSKLASRYEVVSELGRGGMGAVYLAQDPLLERRVAVKVISPNLLSQQDVERFKREARIIAKMDHPAIVAVHDTGEHEGSLFFVMPYVAGMNLRMLMENRSLSIADVLEVGIQVAEALEYTHNQGVIHRDIKPENILITREERGEIRVRITDFGLAMVSTENRLTASGAVVGTVSYFSPEHLLEGRIDGRADLYSLATVLYECLVGEPPFNGEIHEVLYRIVHERPLSIRTRNVSVPKELDAILLQCLQKDPDHRPTSAKKFAEALHQCRLNLLSQDRDRAVLAASETLRIRKPVFLDLTGREEEFAELQERLHTAIQGQCQFVVITGDPGIGKTRLMDELEFLAKARKIQVLRGRFVDEKQAFSYQGFCEAIQEYFRYRILLPSSPSIDFSDLAPDLRSLFPSLTEIKEITSVPGDVLRSYSGTESKKIEDRTYIFEVLARTLLRIAAGKPLVLLFEDLHAADASIHALQYIVHRLGPSPTLIVGTYRSSEVDKQHPLTQLLNTFQGGRHFTLIQLKPFRVVEYRAFLEKLIATTKLESSLVQSLYEATEGNPYFTKELIRSLMDAGGIAQDDSGTYQLSGETGSWSEMLPATIQQTVEKRIERLPDDLREILSIASVLGKTFRFHDLHGLTEGKENLEEALERLQQEGFIEEDRASHGDQWMFSSGVLREVLYAALSRRKRKLLHRNFAELLERSNPGRLERAYPQLLHHYSQADIPEKVVEFGLQLIGKSLHSFRAEEAIRAARTVLEFLEDQQNFSLEADVRAMLAAAYRMAGKTESAFKELENVIRILEKEGKESAIVAAIVTAAETAWQVRRIDEARKWVDKGLPPARKVPDKEHLSRLLSLGATVANLRGEYDAANIYLEELATVQPPRTTSEHRSLKGGRLVVAMPNAIPARHPVQMKMNEEWEVLANVFEPLLITDEQGRLIPSLCERWETVLEGKSFLLTLRSNVLMHDGRRLTAQLVKSSFETAIRIGQSSLPPAYASIQGATEFLEGRTPEMRGIVVLAENRLGIELQEPLPIYPALLTDVRTAIAGVATNTVEGASFVGTGPFQIALLAPDQVVLERNPNYWRGPSPHLDAIEFRAAMNSADIARGLRTGEIDLARDLLPQDLEEILRDQRLRAGLVETPKKNVYFVLFSSSSPLCSLPAVRKAACGVIRVHDLVRGTLGRFAQPAEGLIPPGILGYDPARRRPLLTREEALQMLQSASPSLPIRLSAAVHPIFQDRYASLINALLKAWSEIGIEISIETPTMESYLQRGRNNQGIDLLIGRWNADYDDPDSFTHGLFHSRMGRYPNFYSSREMDELMEEARRSRAPVRERLYRRMENILLENSQLLPLFHDIDYRVAGPKVRQLTLRSIYPYVNYAEVAKIEEPTSTLRKSTAGIIHVPISGELRSFDPSLTFLVLQGEIIPNVFETLTREARGARIIPWLASEYHVEEGGRRFRFRLREDVRFHDGRRLTARDVRYSFERMLANPASETRFFFSPIRGARRLLDGKGGMLDGFGIVSASEFTIDLDQPISFFPALLTYPAASILPEGADQFQASWREGCVGTGPFRIGRFEVGRKLELEANPYYWRSGFPRSDGLVFHFNVSPEEILAQFRAGKFSVACGLYPADAEALRHESDFAANYCEIPGLSTYYAAFNAHHGPLSDEKLRHRLTQAIDVEKLIQHHLGQLAIPAHGLIPPGLLGYEPLRKTPSISSQREPLTAEIEVIGMLNSAYQGTYAQLATDLLNRFRENGVHVRIAETRSEYFSNQPQALASADLLLTRWIADFPDSDSIVHALLPSETGVVGRLCGTPEIDQLIEKARTETDPENRHYIYREIDEILVRRALVLPLFHEQSYCFARPEVEGLEMNLFIPIIAYEKLWIHL